LSPEQKSPFLLKARENRTNLRQKKAQQVSDLFDGKLLLKKIIYVKQPITIIYENHGLISLWDFYIHLLLQKCIH